MSIDNIETIEVPKEEVKIVHNSDVLYRSDIKWVTPEYQEPNEKEKKMLENTKNPIQLLEEEKNEANQPNEPISEEEEAKIVWKERVMKVKVISLDDMNKHPLANPSYFSSKDKAELLKLMKININLTDDKLTEKFNQICIDKLFTEKSDYTTYPVYKTLV